MYASRLWLKELRERKELTNYELAKRCQVTPQAIWLFETGQRTPGLRTALALADELGFDPHRLIDDEEKAG